MFPYKNLTDEQRVIRSTFDAFSLSLFLSQSVEASPPSLTLHHEGFLWRCGFQVEPTVHATLATLFSMYTAKGFCWRLSIPVAHASHSAGWSPCHAKDSLKGKCVQFGYWTVNMEKTKNALHFVSFRSVLGGFSLFLLSCQT